jgi:hypothetical protein
VSFFKREIAGIDKVREVEVEIRELVRQDCLRPNPEADSDLVTNSISSLLERVAGTSVQEIERLIAELRSLRETLSTEGERVRREIVQYAALSQAAMQSTKAVCTENLVRYVKSQTRQYR